LKGGLTVEEGVINDKCSTGKQHEASDSAKKIPWTTAHTSSPLLLG